MKTSKTAKILKARQAADATIANINAMSTEDKKALGRHLLGKYGHLVQESYKDRIEELAAGYDVDRIFIKAMDDLGVVL
jgi:hypothetical protein